MINGADTFERFCLDQNACGTASQTRRLIQTQSSSNARLGFIRCRPVHRLPIHPTLRAASRNAARHRTSFDTPRDPVVASMPGAMNLSAPLVIRSPSNSRTSGKEPDARPSPGGASFLLLPLPRFHPAFSGMGWSPYYSSTITPAQPRGRSPRCPSSRGSGGTVRPPGPRSSRIRPGRCCRPCRARSGAWC